MQTIIFQNELIHPLICPYTGALDIISAFPHWRTGEDHIWQLLKYVQAIFLDPLECLRLATSAATTVKLNNKEAADLLTQNRAEFIAKVKLCVSASQQRVYEEPPTEDPHYLCFEPYDAELHEPVLQKLKAGKASTSAAAASATEKSAGGLSWVKEGEFKPLSVD